MIIFRKTLAIILFFKLSLVSSQIILNSNTTWSGLQFLSQKVIVNQGVKLTILPSTTIQIGYVDSNADGIGDVEIEVNGRIVILGAPVCSPVIFRPFTPTANRKYWKGIKINSNVMNDSIIGAEIYNAEMPFNILTNSTISNCKIRLFDNVGVNFMPTSSGVQLKLLATNIKTGKTALYQANPTSTLNADWIQIDSCINGIIGNTGNLNIKSSLIYNSKRLGVSFKDGNMSIFNSKIKMNYAFGIFNSSGNLLVKNCDIDTNYLGGVLIAGVGTNNILNSNIRNNRGSQIENTDYGFNINVDGGYSSFADGNPTITANFNNILGDTLITVLDSIGLFDLPTSASGCWASQGPLFASCNFINACSTNLGGVSSPLIYRTALGRLAKFWVGFGASASSNINTRCFGLSIRDESSIINLGGTGGCAGPGQYLGMCISNPNQGGTFNVTPTYVQNKYLFVNQTGISSGNFLVTAYMNIAYYKFGGDLLFNNIRPSIFNNAPVNFNFQNNNFGQPILTNYFFDQTNQAFNYQGFTIYTINNAGVTFASNLININQFPKVYLNTSTGRDTSCISNNFYLIAPSSLNTSYNWYLNGNIYVTNNNNQYVPPISGSWHCVVVNPSCSYITTARNLIINPSPIITVNSGAICVGQNFTINPNGAYTYTIQGGNAVVSPASNANYTVVGTSTAGCVSQAFATSNLTVNPYPIITVNNGTICAGQNYSINPNGANTYTIQGGNAVVSPTSNTSYTVVGTSTAGCISQAFATSNLIVIPSPTISVNSGAICPGQNFTINPNGANTYTIQGGNAVVSPAGNSSYTVVGTSTAGCVSQAFATSNLTVNPNPIITVNNGAICVGQNFTINPNGANTYTIQGGSAVVSPTSNTSFTVSGTSGAGCLSQAFATSNLTVNPNPTITVNNGTICVGQNFTINPSGANTYTIQGGNAVVSPPSNTSYTVIGTNSVTGCRSQAFATSSLLVNANPIITVNSGAICAGQNFTINPNGANNYTIQGGNAVVSPAGNTSYTVAGTSTAGCVSQAFATSNLIVNANPIITVNNGVICAGQNFTINPNGANTYTIQGGNAVVSPAGNTSYTVAGTSTAGCLSQAFATSNLTVNPNPTITVNNGTICVGQNFTINPNGANTYTIQGGNAVVSPPSNTSYTVIGTNSVTGCLSQAFATSSLLVNANPTITVNSGAICPGQNFTINPNGANTYTIQGGNAVVSPAGNTSYTVAGTSTAGCVSQAFATSNLTVNQNPTITVNNGAICAGQNFTINPNGANTYTIQGANAVVSPSINTTYTVIGTNTITGCRSQSFATSNLTVNPNPTITVNNGTICVGQNFTINPNGANTYTIQGGNAVVSPPSNANYTVIGTNSFTGCRSQAFATSSLIVNANPIITVNSGAICAGQNFTINPNGANTYTIQGGNAVVSPAGNTSYTVAGTSTAGCVSQAFATSNITVNLNPTITVNNGTICAGQNFTINANGANFYMIQGGNSVVSPLSNSSYTVAGISIAGCLSQTFATSYLMVNPSPTVTANTSATAVCAGTSVTLNGGGALTYTWSAGIINAVSFIPTLTINYTLIGANAYSCVNTATIQVIVNAIPTLSLLVSSQAYCIADINGALSGYPSGGIWNGPGVSGNAFIPSIAGFGYHNVIYTFTDLNGCVNSKTIIMTVDLCTGIKEMSNHNLFSVYPNPTKGVINLKADYNLFGTFYNIYDNTGKFVLTGKIKSETTVIELDNLSKGIYLIRVGENFKQTFKFIKE